MDPFDDLLQGVRADGAGLRRTDLAPPWSVPLGGTNSLTLCTVLTGEGRLDRGDAVRAGDSVVVKGPEAVELSGTEPAGLLSGAYETRGTVARRLVGVLPEVMVVPGHAGCAPLLDFLAGSGDGGRPVVRDRLLDWLLVCALRGWFDRPGAVPPGWFGALGDEVVGPVLRVMHAAPERPWTLVGLAAEAGVSRTTLADRFVRLVGTPPLTYLTSWRMSLAADRLTGTRETVGAVARRVGYADAFGFSAAFKRVYGVSPSVYRRSGGAGSSAGEGPTGAGAGAGAGPGPAGAG
ncbi:AraC family transcriptional regulator [Streptomyces roseirectus]|uniref:AraC family transcriptional regulator n=1 Tax=Streptomyces roseirectus TaxID=2768066 RepID=A0A7H0IP80_9ACTN|nr:AraC family transcriptional regulator [Streptomyces roseirectus]QNP74596.1 AraC family transcriptional regulator [Streptomyces roseirectus]